MPSPEFTWDAKAGQYRGPGGKFISRREVRTALDTALRREQRTMRELTLKMKRGELTVGEWHVAMRAEIKSVHLMSAALAKGGFGQMTQGDYGRVGQILRGQYTYLAKFAQQIAFNGLPIDGRALRRVDMYFGAGRKTYHATQTAVMTDVGHDEERSVLHPADHCDDCIEEAAKGWSPIGSLIPIGDRQCLSHCKCTMEYRRSTDQPAD